MFFNGISGVNYPKMAKNQNYQIWALTTFGNIPRIQNIYKTAVLLVPLRCGQVLLAVFLQLAHDLLRLELTFLMSSGELDAFKAYFLIAY